MLFLEKNLSSICLFSILLPLSHSFQLQRRLSSPSASVSHGRSIHFQPSSSLTQRSTPTFLYSSTAATDSDNDDVSSPPISTTSSTTTTNTNTNDSLSQLTRRIAIPAAIGMLADPVLGLIDTAYVGRLLGATELAAVGVCTSIFHLAFSTFRATTQATTSLIANAADDDDEKVVVASTSLQAAWVAGMLVAAVLAVTGRTALRVMGIATTTSPLYAPAACYLYTRLYFAPVVLYCGVAEGVFRGYSDTVTPLRASWVAAVLNFVLDPLLMMASTLNMGVKGAAIATAASQVAAALVYRRQLRKRGYTTKSKNSTTTTWQTRWAILRAILAANGAALWKQSSLLIAWAYATACATRLGQVAAHQVGLSVWLVSAFLLDATGVAAQVLRTQADDQRVLTLQSYFSKLAIVQGIVAAVVLWGAGYWGVPDLFTRDVTVRAQLRSLVPHLAWTQVLVSMTLVAEGLAAGANQFRTLAVGTTVATIVSVLLMQRQSSIAGIWGVGIGALFVGRLLTAVVASWRAGRKQEAATGVAAVAAATS